MRTILYILCFISTVSARCQWPGKRSYTYTVKITCSEINSSNIHQEVSKVSVSASYYNFTFENSSIRTFPMNVFVPLKKGNVLYLYLNKGQIETIQTGAFSGLLEVREIYLQFNSLNVISRGCFNSLFKLKILDLSHNNVNLIEDDAFNGSNELRKIFLNDNNVTSVPRLLFHSLKLLEYVNLTNNKINTFDVSFSNFAIFKTISLNNNKISGINCDTLRGSFLDVIELENNQLSEMDGFCFPNITEELILKNNFINKITNTTEMKQLKYLDLSDNNISELNPNEFKDLKKLENLTLPKNYLSGLTPGIFKDLASLTSLNVSGNSIRSLEFGVFNGLEKLNNLDLSSNKLEVLEEDVFHNLNLLKVLNVSHNNLQYINLVKLKSYSNSLEQIDLIGNNISCQKLSSMFSYKLNFKIAHSVFHNVSNVNGIPCINFNVLLKNNENKFSSNIFQEIKSFLDSDFKNTSFYKFFSENHTNVSRDEKSTDTMVNFQKYLQNKDSNLSYEFNQILTQIDKSNTIFIVFTVIIAFILCAPLFIIIVLLKKLLKYRTSPIREPEMHLL